MPKKIIVWLLIIFTLILSSVLLFAKYNVLSTSTNNNKPKNQNLATTHTINYLISPEDTTKYCNGVDMDTDGYRKTITVQMTTKHRLN